MFKCIHSVEYRVKLDIDQCTTNNGGCQQICTNLLPGFACSCYSGFVLNDDGKSCSGMSSMLYGCSSTYSLFPN